MIHTLLHVYSSIRFDLTNSLNTYLIREEFGGGGGRGREGGSALIYALSELFVPNLILFYHRFLKKNNRLKRKAVKKSFKKL